MRDRYIIVLAALAAMLILLFSDFGRHQSKVYDCGMAEWHPDIPTKVKEECRKLRREIELEREKNRA